MNIKVNRRSVLATALSAGLLSSGFLLATELHVLLVKVRKAFLLLRDRFSLITEGEIEFSKSTPESQGMDSRRLDALRASLAERKTKAFVVLRNDQLVYEWYSPDHNANKKHYIASAAKSVVGSLVLAIALNDGLIRLDDPASKYIPGWADDKQKSQITIEHLTRHSSGLENYREDGKVESQLPGWKGRYQKNKEERWKISAEEVPVTFEPGTQYDYSNPGTTAFSYILAKALHNANTNTYEVLHKRIMEPLGVPEHAYSISYKQVYNADGVKLFYIDGGADYTAKALARVGSLMLNKGVWQGKELFSSQFVEKLVAYTSSPPPNTLSGHPAPGLLWHTNQAGTFPSLPSDAFLAIGRGYQLVCIIPSLDLVIVRLGGFLIDEDWTAQGWQDLDTTLFKPLMASMISD